MPGFMTDRVSVMCIPAVGQEGYRSMLTSDGKIKRLTANIYPLYVRSSGGALRIGKRMREERS